MERKLKAKWLGLVLLALFITGCNTSIIEKLALEPTENGFVCVQARVDVNSNPFATTWADIKYIEYGDAWPEDVPRPQC